MLNDVGKSLKDYSWIPFLEEAYRSNSENRLIAEEMGYNKLEMKELHDQFYPKLNENHLDVYHSIISNVDKGEGGLFLSTVVEFARKHFYERLSVAHSVVNLKLCYQLLLMV